MAQILDARGNEFGGALDTITGQTITDARSATANLGALNAEAISDLNGHCVALIDVRAPGSLTLSFEGTVDGVNYYALPAINQATEQIVTTTAAAGTFYVSTAGFRRIRARVSAYTSGTVIVAIRASLAEAIVKALPFPATSSVTNTGAAAAAVTLTLGASGAGLYHYITRLIIQRFATALLTAGTTPVLVTTTNLPGTRVFSFPAEAAAQGTIYSEILEPSQPLKSSVANTATTIVCPATTGVIWRVTADYYVGA